MVDVSGAFDMKPTKAIEVRTATGIRSADFFPGYGGIFYPNDPSIEKVVDKGGYPLPDGFLTGYTAVYEHLSLTLDSRKPRPEPGSGVHVILEGEPAGDIRGRGGWVRYGGTVDGFWDVTGTNRVLSLSFAAAFADPLATEPVPFTELAALGGDLPMPGFLPGRLFGRARGAHARVSLADMDVARRHASSCRRKRLRRALRKFQTRFAAFFGSDRARELVLADEHPVNNVGFGTRHSIMAVKSRRRDFSSARAVVSDEGNVTETSNRICPSTLRGCARR